LIVENLDILVKNVSSPFLISDYQKVAEVANKLEAAVQE